MSIMVRAADVRQAGERKYDRWRLLYTQLAVLDVDRQEVRSSPRNIAKLRELGWQITPEGFDAYWQRVKWVSDRCTGRVLEIGCGVGNVTRWIAANPEVTEVVAVDRLASYLQILEGFRWPKVTPVCADVLVDAQNRQLGEGFDTVVLAEVIEHLSLSDEALMASAVLPRLARRAQWLISTPVGFMPDPDHRRGFGRRFLRWHARLLYGPIEETGSNGPQQYLVCSAEGDRKLSVLWLRVLAARLLAWAAALIVLARRVTVWGRCVLTGGR
jgi:2-polyprenyl-3-methyl-5-hydroxy-6-metoxy-1,4-benzoquinol methylase